MSKEELKNLVKGIREAYRKSLRDYHNSEYWEDEQWDRIDKAEERVLSAIDALKIIKEENV